MNEYIRLEPISFMQEDNKYIDFRVNCSFCHDINFYRGDFSIDTGKFFSVQSCTYPELTGDYNGTLYIQGDDIQEDNRILSAPLKVFIFINTQVKIADEMLKASASVNDDADDYDEECEDDF